MRYRYVIPGPAVPQGRPRLTTIHGHARAYTPAQTRKYQAYVRACVMEQGRPKEPLMGVLRVDTVEYRAMPKAFGKEKRARAMRGDIRPGKRPDMDNIEKTIWDALTGLVWKDDAQVVDGTRSKFYSDAPRVEVIVEEIEADLG